MTVKVAPKRAPYSPGFLKEQCTHKTIY